MLNKLLAMTKAELKSKIQSIDESAVKGRAMRRKLAGMKKKEGGFTLLELLVVVAILAAIAGTATIMLHDTDKKAFAAAHVAMMDELSKGILTFQQLNGGNYPNNWDSLMHSATGTLTGAVPAYLLNDALSSQLTADTLTATDIGRLDAVGINQVRVLSGAVTYDHDDDPATANVACANDAAGIGAIIASKGNDVTVQNIFRSSAANGCGAAASATMVEDDAVLVWNGGNERVNAPAGARLLAFGVGPDSTLFQSTNYGALTNTPIYRHVAATEYNRFLVLFNVTSDPTSPTNGKATLQAIIDGAGDTKDEELGEFDNVRPT
ncbi:MAG: prepilin-type N-terminal cleavage/methylation domain-containing protein [Dechloromonas sp.]|nr:MAG: prepilin-type N-terminal cleavage/methylation domain-containing protein [Dechloromonas sp.]